MSALEGPSSGTDMFFPALRGCTWSPELRYQPPDKTQKCLHQ